MNYGGLSKIELTEDVTKEDIKKLDEWLVRTPYSSRKALNFHKFAMQEDIAEDKALIIIMEAVKVGVLRLYFRVVEDKGWGILGEYSKLSEVPKRIYSENQGKEVDVKDKNIEVLFSLEERSTRSIFDGKDMWDMLNELD